MNENIFAESKKGDQVALIHELSGKAWIAPIVRIWGSGPVVVDHPTVPNDEIVVGIDGDAFHVHLKGRWAAFPIVNNGRGERPID